MRVVVLLVALLMPLPVWGQSCPQPLASASRLVLVTADTMHGSAARLQRFTRAGAHGPWRPESGPVSAQVGRNGIAWGYPFRALARAGEPIKIEGDKRAPAGFYTIGRPFGLAASLQPGYLHLTEGTVCVAEPAHPAYNTISTRAQVGNRVHAENMWRVPEYRRGLLVDYPSNAAARGGSCIFIHLAVPGKTGTGGCVALAEPALASLQDFARGGAVLAILPREALSRFRGCLPAVN